MSFLLGHCAFLLFEKMMRKSLIKKKNLWIVDFGGFDGSLLFSLSEKLKKKRISCMAVCLDLIPYKKYEEVFYLKADFTKPPLQKSSVDVVVSSNIADYLDILEPNFTKKELFLSVDYILKKGGIYIAFDCGREDELFEEFLKKGYERIDKGIIKKQKTIKNLYI